MHCANWIARPWACTLAASLIIAFCAAEVGREEAALSGLHRQTSVSELLTAAQPDVPTQAAYSKVPLHFEANQGQSDPQVKFLARGSSYTLFLTATEAVLALPQKPEGRSQGSEVKFSDSSPKALQVIPKPHLWMPASTSMTGVAARDVIPAVSADRQAQAGIQSSGEKGVLKQLLDSRLTVRMYLVGANPQPRVTGEDELPGKSHYFFGSDPTQWHTNISTYARVKYEDVYPGVDLVYYGNQQQLEYDFVVAPGADPTVIRLAFADLRGPGLKPGPTLDGATGDLVLHTADGELRFHQPRIYQEIDGTKQPIAGRYVLFDSETADSGLRTQQVGFEVAAYDSSKPLIIDPTLSYSTVISGDIGAAIAVDSSGNAYVTGITSSPDFPTTAGASQQACRTNSRGGCYDVFVLKLNAEGSALLYATYLGGSDLDESTAITVDASGNASVTGRTLSIDLPTIPGAFDRGCGTDGNCNGTCGDHCDLGNDRAFDAFVAKLNATGSALVYSTYLGGSRDEEGRGITVDTLGNAYVTGNSYSPDFPTVNPLQPAFGVCPPNCANAFVTKLNATGSGLVYSTYFAVGQVNSIAVDLSGNAYITGSTGSDDFPTVNPLQATRHGLDAFITKVNASGSALLYSTYLGGSDREEGRGITVDSSGNVYVTGVTTSPDFPTLNPVQPSFGGSYFDAFITKVNTAGSALVYSTYLGGSSQDEGNAIAVDLASNAYVTGVTYSDDFPTARPLQPTRGSGICPSTGTASPCPDAFVIKLNTAGNTLLYSTYLGGSGSSTSDTGSSIVVDAAGNAYVTGSTSSADFPTENPLQPVHGGGYSEVFIAKIADAQQEEILAHFESPEATPFASALVGIRSSVAGIALIRGWAFATQSDTHIHSVELFIDGQPAGAIPCCSQRADVQTAFPQFPADNTLNSGWGITFNWGLLEVGFHAVRVKIRDTAGHLVFTESREVIVVKPGDFEFLDRFDLSGAAASIEGDELIVEGIVVRDKATQQQKRINARFRWFESSQSLGMVEATTVAEVASLRSFFAPLFASLSAWFRGGPVVANALEQPQLTSSLESPEQEQVVAGVGIIRGWAFDEAGSVPPLLGLMIDGRWGGRIPCCSDRADVAAAFPDQPAALHSGWGTVFNYGLLSAGPHTIGVAAEYWSYAKVLGTHAVTVVRVGEFEYLDQFGLSGATARIEGDTLVLSGVVVRDKASQQRKTIDVWLRWVESAQGLGIVAASE
ncbi:MAG TPA: SBBP repeat-containing protein [Candidatus Binatia bacterium]|nr:SBBP repeat-containing protein [Candidatus Binatia bacterium]